MKKSIIYKSILVVLGIAGICGQLGVGNGNVNLQMLWYFTVLSNVAVVVYFAADIIFLLVNKKSDRDLCPLLKGTVTAGIIVTFIIVVFVLRMGVDMSTSIGRSFLLVHFIVPLMTFGDWLLFSSRRIGVWEPPIWYLEPLLYLIMIVSTGSLREGAGGPSKYIYPFLDVDKLGMQKVVMMILILTAVFFAGANVVRYMGNKRRKVRGS
jgi:hypothetical protein